LAFRKWTIASPSVWAVRTWETWISKELLERVDAHPAPDIVLGHDQRPRLGHGLVPPGVIPVPVGVEHEAERLSGDLGNRLPDLGPERRELIVNDEHAVLAGGDPDVAAEPDQHPHASG
jgi:hypothetical protein